MKTVTILLFCTFLFTSNLYAQPPINVDVGIKLDYKGAIRFPRYVDPLGHSNVFIAHDGNNGLYYGGRADFVGKIGLVGPVIPINGDLSTTNIADDLHPPVLATRSRIDGRYTATANGIALTDLAVSQNRLYVNHGKYYDVYNEPNLGFSSVDLDLTKDNFQGFYDSDIQPSKLLSGSVVAIPSNWQLANNFQFLNGEYWNSNGGGPSIKGVKIDSQNKVTSTQVLEYSVNAGKTTPNFTLRDRHWSAFAMTLDNTNYIGIAVAKAGAWWYGLPDPWSDPNAHRSGCLFNAGNPIDKTTGSSCLDKWNSLGLPIPPLQPGEIAIDKCSSSKGYHAATYAAMLYYYNETSLISALSSAEKNINPIIVDISQNMLGKCGNIYGADVHGNELYVIETGVDFTRSQYNSQPIVHVFEINNSAGGNPPPSVPTGLKIEGL